MAASKQKKDDPFVVTFEERGDQTIVRKSNDLVQMTRNNLTLSQQRLMLHIFSMIKPEDTDLPSYELSIYDFIKMTGMDPHSGALYKQVRKNIEELANAPRITELPRWKHSDGLIKCALMRAARA